AIAYEGVDSLSVPELQTACASRGLRTHGMSPGRLRDDLQSWLDLRLKYGVPSTLLVMSNAFLYAQGKETEFESQIDALQAVLSSIPDELFHETELDVHTAEGAATNKQRLEVLKEQQELINEENEQRQNGSSSREDPKDDEDIDEKEDRDAALAAEKQDAGDMTKDGPESGKGEGMKADADAGAGKQADKKA
ncbi:LETM1 domain-containing protein ylh47, partial [Cryomyces antarcticus]